MTDVSVCVSTRNRAGDLDRLLDALDKQTIGHDRFDVVITDDGSTDATPDVLNRLREQSRVRLTVRRHEVSRGAAAGRNTAWRAGQGALCAFTDDDCRPTTTWLEHGLAAMAEPGFVVGAVEPAPEDEERIGPFSRFLRVTAGQAGWTPTANLLVRRDDLERVGGFDERYRVGEDADLGLRLQAAGESYRFDPSVLVHHAVVDSTWQAMVREQQRWVDLPLVIASNPAARGSLLVGGLFWKRTHAHVLMALAAMALRRRPLLAAALALPWLHERSCTNPAAGTRAEQLASLPGTFAVDTSELVALVRGSAKHGTLVL